MTTETNIINVLYSHLPKLSATDKKIATVVLADPKRIVNMTIAALAKTATVSEASISRFCKNIGLAGFHQLKIELATAATDKSNYYHQITATNLDQALQNISKNKVAEVVNTLQATDPQVIQQTLTLLKTATLVQVAAAGGTMPVAMDAVYKFNQLGILALTDPAWETAIGQTLNLPPKAVLLVISNSGETRHLLTQIKSAQQQGIKVIAITNRSDSPVGQAADLHILTAVRQQIFESEYFFSRISAMTVIEALFLLLLAENKQYSAHIKAHEALIAQTKI